MKEQSDVKVTYHRSPLLCYTRGVLILINIYSKPCFLQDEQLAEQQEKEVKEVMINRNRNGSVLSKQSLEANTPQLSRVGSLQNKALVKQESTLSGMSLGSGSSGKYTREFKSCYT